MSKTGAKSANKRSCVVPTCVKERFDLVHKFPMEDERTKQWLNAVNVKHLWSVPFDKLRSSYFVCSRHFRNADYKNAISRSINKTAIPSLNLTNLNDLHLVLHRSKPRPPELSDPQINDKVIPIPRTTPTENIITKEVKCLLNRKHKITNIDNQPIQIIKKTKKKIYNLNEIRENQNFNIPIHLIKINRICENDPIDITNNETTKQEIDIIDNGSVLEESDNAYDNRDEENLIYDDETTMPTSLEVSHPEYSDITNLNYFWLRDHCKCKICYNIDTHQRNYNILDISLDVKPNIVDANNDKLYIKWNDNHESEYDYEFLFKNSNQNFNIVPNSDKLIKQILWDKQKITENEFKYAKIDFGNFLKNDNLAKDAVKSLIQYGFAFIENVPPTADMTEMTVRRLFPIQKTFFGEMWTFSDKKADHADFAYTNKFLLAHNDNTYFNDPAGLITFHCIKHNGDGGETILVDGFKILNDLKINNPKSYETLCNINVPSEYIEDGQYHKYTAPIIKLNTLTNQPEQIRYNLYDRSTLNTLSQNDMDTFYKSLKELTCIIQSPQNELRFKLNPGTVVIFDNWRLLHGRAKYSGLRSVAGCYIQRTDYLSKARIYGLIS